jgi:hypothetical protein
MPAIPSPHSLKKQRRRVVRFCSSENLKFIAAF